MSSAGTPAAQDPDRLREEIVETRAELADTVEALAAKTDVKGRAKHAAASAVDDAVDGAKQRIAGAVEQTRRTAGDAADAITDKAGAAVTSVRDTVQRTDLRAQAGRPLPWAALAAALAVAGVIVYVTRRRRA